MARMHGLFRTGRFKKNKAHDDKMVTALPTVKGFTVDMRLRQFRKVDPKRGMEFIDFDSPKGEQLLKAYMRLTNQMSRS